MGRRNGAGMACRSTAVTNLNEKKRALEPLKSYLKVNSSQVSTCILSFVSLRVLAGASFRSDNLVAVVSPELIAVVPHELLACMDLPQCVEFHALEPLLFDLDDVAADVLVRAASARIDLQSNPSAK